MRFVFGIFLVLSTTMLPAQSPLPPIGEWREHLPYGNAISLAASANKIFCATPFSLFTVSLTDNSMGRLSRMTGLHETGVRTIAFDAVTEKLFIAYDNSNIDILFRNDVFNIPDIKRDNIAGDKTINAVYPSGGNFYLSTGLGIIVIDGEQYEVKESWLIGNGGGQVKVNGFCSDGTFYYAATEEGLKKAPVNSQGLADYANWETLSGNNGLPAGSCSNVLVVQNRVVAERNDSLFAQTGSAWSLLYTDGWSFEGSNVAESKILLCQQHTSGTARVVILNPDGTVSRIIAGAAVVTHPKMAILYSGTVWVADQQQGLSRFDASSSFEPFIPNSPRSVSSGMGLVYKDVFYTTAGGITPDWLPLNNSGGLFFFKEGSWNNIYANSYPQLDSLKDFMVLAIDKRDESIWAGSFGGGLLHVQPGPVFEIFKQNILGPVSGNPMAYRVAGLAFDAEHHLWICNYGADQPLRLRKADGNWRNFAPPFSLAGNAISQILVDDNNYKWIVSPGGNGLLCYDHGSDIDNSTDDRWRRFGFGAGNGNLPSAHVLCLAKDKSGFIWVGTADGAGLIQCPEQVFGPASCDAVWPVVPSGNFAGYLFKGQEVRGIAVDGADRKWVATNKGAFLVDANGEKMIYEFTAENSLLLSNDVRGVTIDGKTGEVYFATVKGICSFRGTATDGAVTNEEVLVFPNPVPPGFTGTIAIRGLVNNAIVKITELDGRLVYQTRALGGQAVWYGRNYRGQKISSGAYLVLVSDEGKKERTAAKIFFIQR